jgi:hypothetical protein
MSTTYNGRRIKIPKGRRRGGAGVSQSDEHPAVEAARFEKTPRQLTAGQLRGLLDLVPDDAPVTLCFPPGFCADPRSATFVDAKVGYGCVNGRPIVLLSVRDADRNRVNEPADPKG